MDKAVTNIFEILIGAILFSLGLLYLVWHYQSLSNLSEYISQKIIEDDKIIRQYKLGEDKVKDLEVYGAIMGYREYPIMVDGKLIPTNENDYDLYFSYIKKGYYKKDYLYDDNRCIIMVLYSYLSI
ncbi:hypothetical protein [Herbinix luporum]|jgi:hypothetical protein|uniref:Type II secretion system protein n=1 Tax=Herbinix luporum TaxID=1679721 RepID=A0A0K8J729_9FIRM|nr:hypothetical protein [Herbinix luporum]CUH93234.1 hypothetical protein SD1D_1689 [Herbinix luporum]HHT57783.1 hypothetical protein [Herbinix luporum]